MDNLNYYVKAASTKKCKNEMCYTLNQMYPLDRRLRASFIYSLFPSLMLSAIVLQVSHTTVSRWLKLVHWPSGQLSEQRPLERAASEEPFWTHKSRTPYACSLVTFARRTTHATPGGVSNTINLAECIEIVLLESLIYQCVQYHFILYSCNVQVKQI